VGRIARVIAVGVAHHVSQRGNGRRFLLESDADRRVYLDLLRENLALHEVLLVGYCLLSNHGHLIVLLTDAEGENGMMLSEAIGCEYCTNSQGSRGERLRRDKGTAHLS